MTSNTVNPTMLKQQQSPDSVQGESNKKQGGYNIHQNHPNHFGNNQRGYSNNHTNNYNGNRRMDKKKQNNNQNNTNNTNNNSNNSNTNSSSNNSSNGYAYGQNAEGVQVVDQNYYNATAVGDEQAAIPAYHYYPMVQPQPVFYAHAADAPYYSTTQPAPLQAAGSPAPVGIYPPGSVITVANTQNLQVPNRVMQIPCYSTNQIGGYNPPTPHQPHQTPHQTQAQPQQPQQQQQQQQNHNPRYNRHLNNRRSQQGQSSSNSNNNNSHFSSSTPSTTTNIYVSGLSASTTDESFADMCKSWGKIISSKAIINNETDECKGFGFVMYENEEQARSAMEQLNNKGYHVSFAKDSLSARLKNLQDEESTNIYISNIPLDMTNEQFSELFKPHHVVSQTILRDQSGVSRGVGFARFESRAIAKIIIDKYNNVKLEGGVSPLQVRFADSNAQKKLKEQVASKKYSNTPKIKYQNNIAPPEQLITYSYYGSPVMPPTSPLPMQAQLIPQSYYPAMLSPMIAPASPSLIYIENMNENGNVEGYDAQPETSTISQSQSNNSKMDRLSINMQNKLRINDENSSK